MYECEIGQGLLGNSVARAMGGAVQDATLPFLPGEPLAAKSSKEAVSDLKAGPPGPQRRHRQRAQVEVDHPAGRRWRQ